MNISTKRERITLEQARMNNAWKACAAYQDEHVKAAKGLPGLIMNSGLMQVLAFCQEKKSGAINQIGIDLRKWLAYRFSEIFPENANFQTFMEKMMSQDSTTYQAMHAEALAWLRWLRQLAAARQMEK